MKQGRAKGMEYIKLKI